MNIQEFKLLCHQTFIAVKAFGNPKDKPMLALHGWLDNAASFNLLAPLIRDHYIVAIDFPGHGLSEYRAGEIFHYIDYCFEVMDVAEQLNWDAFALLGHSLGGGIASMLAGTFPKRIKQLILIDALGPLTLPADAGPAQLHSAIERYQGRHQRNLPQYDTLEEAAQARANKGLSVDAARILTERGAYEKSGKFTWRSDPRLTLPSAFMFTEIQVHAFLKNIAAQTCLVRPKDGIQIPEDMWLSRTQCVPEIEIFKVNGGHHVHMEDPETVANCINQL